MESGLNASDVALLENGGGFGGGNSFLWIFALLILANGGFGFGGRAEPYATAGDVQRGFDTNALEQQIRGITNGIADLGYAIDNKIEGTKDFLTAGIGGVKDAVTNEGRGLQMQIANGHCDNQRNVDALRFDMANYHADTNAVTVAQTQKILDAISGNRMADMQNQINQLQLQNAVAGVVRYPQASTYYAGTNPFCGCCNNQNI